MIKKWIFIIDTDSYAGNFDREMCAYITGQVGMCGVGEDFAKLYQQETGDNDDIFDDYIEYRDFYGSSRPCSIYSSLESLNKSVAIYFDKKPENEIINLMKERAHKFAKLKQIFKLTIIGFRMVEESTEIKIKKI